MIIADPILTLPPMVKCHLVAPRSLSNEALINPPKKGKENNEKVMRSERRRVQNQKGYRET